MIGVLAAVREPDRFAALVLVGPSPRYVERRRLRRRVHAARTSTACSTCSTATTSAGPAAMAPAIMGNPDRPELAEELTESFCRTDPDDRPALRPGHLPLRQPRRPAAAPVPSLDPAVRRRRDRAASRRRVRAPPPAGQPAGAHAGDRALPQPERPRGDHRRDQGRSWSDLTGLPTSRSACPRRARRSCTRTRPAATSPRARRHHRRGSTAPSSAGPATTAKRCSAAGGFQDLLTVPGPDLLRDPLRARCSGMQGEVSEAAVDLLLAGRTRRCRCWSTPSCIATPPAGRCSSAPSLVDMTDRRRYEAELLLARRRAEQLAAVVERLGRRDPGDRAGRHGPDLEPRRRAAVRLDGGGGRRTERARAARCRPTGRDEHDRRWPSCGPGREVRLETVRVDRARPARSRFRSRSRPTSRRWARSWRSRPSSATCPSAAGPRPSCAGRSSCRRSARWPVAWRTRSTTR